MRLRFVEPMALPSTAKALQAYAGRHYRVTEDGERWLVLVDDSLGVAYDQLLTRLLALHPQLKGYVELVIRRNLTIPVAGIDDLITLKTGTGRSKDALDVEELRRIKAMLQGGSDG